MLVPFGIIADGMLAAIVVFVVYVHRCHLLRR